MGSWFLEGTGGFSGKTLDRNLCSTEYCPYSYGHLSVAYDHINPDLVQISFGAEGDTGITAEVCGQCGFAYGIKGNAPDPADISVATGMVKYELVAREFVPGSTIKTRNIDSKILGIFLAEMLEDRKIKGEVFPGKKASEVKGFTDNAKIYER